MHDSAIAVRVRRPVRSSERLEFLRAHFPSSRKARRLGEELSGQQPGGRRATLRTDAQEKRLWHEKAWKAASLVVQKAAREAPALEDAWRATLENVWLQRAIRIGGRGSGSPTARTNPSLLARAQRLDASGHRDTALDLVYDSIDELMRQRNFLALDSLLAHTQVGDVSADLLLGLLTATLPARKSLPSRRRLFHEVERVLRVRGEYEQGLLTGLEP
jgi:hypothetical protein